MAPWILATAPADFAFFLNILRSHLNMFFHLCGFFSYNCFTFIKKLIVSAFLFFSKHSANIMSLLKSVVFLSFHRLSRIIKKQHYYFNAF